jgi:hypothetical protein
MKILWSRYRRQRPVLTLFALFVAWKSLIALIALLSPGDGYDTSTSLLSSSHGNPDVASGPAQRIPRAWQKFVRWDAVYYTHISEQGHVFEQEWAFGMGLSTAIERTAKGKMNSLDGQGFANACSGLSMLGADRATASILAGVLLSHAAHWLSVIQLWFLTAALTAEHGPQDGSLFFTAAALHIISPAGIFLSAPSSESPF